MSAQLGNALFIKLENAGDRHAPPDTFGEISEIIQRPGINGTAIRRVGSKGEPFEMLSLASAANVSAGSSLIHAYRGMQAQTAYPLNWRGYNFDAVSVRYVVLNVRVQSVAPVSNLIVSGVVSTDTVLVRALWTLIPVAI